MSKHTTGQFEYSFLVMSNDKLIFQLNSQLGSNLISRYYNTTITSYEGQWIHLVGTYDGSSSASGIKIYLNGTRVDDTDFTIGTYVAMSNGTAPIQIGRRLTNYMNGKVSNISIFNNELTSTEVLKLYANGVPQDLSSFTPAPVAWWTLGSNSFFNGTNFICKDLIGSNDGTSVNAGVDALVGDTPRSEANGVGTNQSIPENLVGTTKYSSNNSWSINMSNTARVQDTP